MVPTPKKRKAVPQDVGDVISVKNEGNENVVAAGRGATASVIHGGPMENALKSWRKEMENHIDAQEELLPSDKADLKESVAKVADEVSKGKQADKGRIERLLNMIGGMAPDIFDVALTTLANPLAGMGLIAKKIGERAKLEAT